MYKIRPSTKFQKDLKKAKKEDMIYGVPFGFRTWRAVTPLTVEWRVKYIFSSAFTPKRF